ncbi:FliM/FliN family flagellar motor switch protein [Pseudoprimorskyibacter insulae]|uniref:Flagellar motor switch protein FliN-like C-terminal domain-containing protein n=1 Tax=Pseudoprimorskyibacter insulae TaxID=1695997 RepID=A0A2R8AZU8_9RHOB|nr:FliM/FliN family flagellar motor C-terminal domain-containing protein [Pseudoprimorskyibacter insulae]SPF81556.1 hypothetical protein PRI8871_03380 [Pseudoprimorskyibacter insulae]
MREARGVVTPTRALRRSLSRAADRLWDLPLVTQGMRADTVDQESCLEALNSDELMLLLEGPQGALGLATLSRAVVMGLVEVQTIGLVTPIPPDDRPYTPTDAAMVAPLIDETLAGLEAILHAAPEGSALTGFRFGAMLDDVRTAGLTLEAPEFAEFLVEVDLMGGKAGTVRFFFPQSEICEDPAPGRSDPAPHQEALETVPAAVDVVLPALRLPLSQIRSLKAGQRLVLSGDAVTQAWLVAGRKHRITKGRLGQMNGCLAFRVETGENRPEATGVGPIDLGDAPDGMASPAPMAMDIPQDPVAPIEADSPMSEGLPDLDMDFGSELDGLPMTLDPIEP